MMFISDQDAAHLVDLAIRYTCARLHIPEFGVIDHDELLSRIATRDSEIHRLLIDFLASYRAWFQFHKQIDAEGRQGRLTAAETQRLMSLTDTKDNTRNLIVEKLKSMPPS
jgi:hypothetical protein